MRKEIVRNAKKKTLLPFYLSPGTLRFNFFDFMYEDGMI